MKKYYWMLFFMLAFVCSGSAQNSSSSIKLDYLGIDKVGLPIKMDAGGYYYTYDSIAQYSNMFHNKIILIINNYTGTAFIRIAGHRDFTYLHGKERSVTSTSTVDTTTFRGEGYMIKLSTRKVKDLDSFDDLYKGTLTIKHNKERTVIKIQGAVAKPPF